MGKRGRVVGATVLLIAGAALVVTKFAGGTTLEAAGVAQTGFDLTRILIWGGVGALIASALLFISASAE